MNIRTTKPTAGNKFFITKSKGGYSSCIQGSPTDSQCNVLANCVGYACGRFNEIIGAMKYPLLNCNAENFIERAKNTYGLEISSVPTLGGIMVWQKGSTLSGSDGAGHVAIVEKIIDNNTIYTSESGYGSSAFWNSTRRNTNGKWGLGSGYTFRGCIVNPVIGKITAPTTNTGSTDIANKSVDELAKDVIAGKYGNGDARRNALGSRYDEVQAKVNEILASNSKPTTPSSTPKPQVDILELVKKTIRGDFGNGEARRKALGSNYDEVQRQVNLNLKNGLTRWDNIKLF